MHASAAVLAYQRRSSSGLFTATLSRKDGDFKKTAFMPGCALVSYSPRLVQDVYKHLEACKPGLGLLQQCCAKPALCTNARESFAHYYGQLERELATHGFNTVITACENCYMTLRRFSPGLSVVSLYEVLLETGIPERCWQEMPTAVLHDPCPTRRESAMQESVRELLTQMRYPFEEFELNRRCTICCGSGGMLELKNPRLALRQMRKRCAQTERDLIISYCQSCVEAVEKGGKRGLHLLDLIFNDKVSPEFRQPRQGTLRRWINRYRSKRIIARLAGSAK